MRNFTQIRPLPSLVYAFIILLLTSATASAQEQVASNKAASRKSTASSSRSLPLRRVALKSVVVTGGARVTLTSDAPLDDYSAYRHGERFFVRIPHASAGPGASLAGGDAFDDVRAEQSGEDLVVSFRVRADVAARVAQKFNRLEVVFAAQDQQSGGGSNGNAAQS
ncbi:MAG TPA: hypothetical protein VF064_14930, partial [Pyrinomonadaceae bacterium]